MKNAPKNSPTVPENVTKPIKLIEAPKNLGDLSSVALEDHIDQPTQKENLETQITKDSTVETKKHWLFSELTFGHFLFSQILILVVGVSFLAFIYYILNPDFMKAKYTYNLPVTTMTLSLYLDINNPEDELLTFDSAIIVSGKTSPNSTVIISTNDSDLGTSANDFGEFSKVVSLSNGLNQITINAFDDQGNTKSANRTVFYSEAKI